MHITPDDKAILRDLARRRAEVAASERNRQLYQRWKAHGAAGADRPLIRIELDTFEQELLPGMMHCRGEEARRMEAELLRPMVNFTLFVNFCDHVIRNDNDYRDIWNYIEGNPGKWAEDKLYISPR